jgi:hypothetical protein
MSAEPKDWEMQSVIDAIRERTEMMMLTTVREGLLFTGSSPEDINDEELGDFTMKAAHCVWPSFSQTMIRGVRAGRDRDTITREAQELITTICVEMIKVLRDNGVLERWKRGEGMRPDGC